MILLRITFLLIYLLRLKGIVDIQKEVMKLKDSINATKQLTESLVKLQSIEKYEEKVPVNVRDQTAMKVSVELIVYPTRLKYIFPLIVGFYSISYMQRRKN